MTGEGKTPRKAGQRKKASEKSTKSLDINTFGRNA